MQADIPLPQASTLFVWAEGTLKHGYVPEIPEPAPADSEEPTNIVQSRKSEFTEEPGGQFSYEPREAVWRALEAKLKRYFPGKNVEFDPTETCDGLWGLSFWVDTSSNGAHEYMIMIDPEVDCDDAEFKAALLPSSTPEQREAVKTTLDKTIILFVKKFIPPRPGEEDELQDDEEPSEEVFGDILDMVMEVADQILENPMGGRRKKRKTKRRGKKRSTRKKSRR